jgi:ferredoxin-NADP reductase/Na+-transporting NADH:ubiquinone oxidoreductase subunit NqrB
VFTSFTSLRQRVLALLAAVSMYRLVLMALGTLTALAIVLSLFELVGPGPVEIVVSALVLAVVVSASDALAQRMLRLPWRFESSLVTAAILVFLLQPTLDPMGLLGIALAGLVASISKYLIAWRGRHILNPAAFGAAVVGLTPIGFTSWWVGTPAMSIGVAVLGLLVLWRTEKVRVVLVFLLVAACIVVIRLGAEYQQLGETFDVWGAALEALAQGPLLFLGIFMLSEPLTLPPRRHQQFTVAIVVGFLAGWPIPIGEFTSLGAEKALLIGNLIAFAFALRTAVRLRFSDRTLVTPTVIQLSFEAKGKLNFKPGQYLELDVPHRHPDARGTRREFSIVSTPQDLPLLRIAYRDGGQQHPSSFKRALAATVPGATLAVTGVWGDFLLPTKNSPVLLVAAGIGVTPFVSQLRDAAQRGQQRDAVLVYIASEASELAFREELEEAGAKVIVFTRDKPADLLANWQWAGGVRLDAAGLARVIPDLSARHAYVSGPPRLIADLAPALQRARSLTTDAFAGY